MRFDGKTVVVTGASSGMGRAIALGLAQEGATVVAVARRRERLEALAAEAQGAAGSILPFPGDVSLKQTNEQMIAFALEQTGKLDVLVNNAGIMDEFLPIGEMDDEEWEKVLAVNLTGPMYAMRKAVTVMLQQPQGGHIINVASIGGLRGCRAGAAYTASKHALLGLTKNTAFMYADSNIRCNAVCPGGVDTEVGVNIQHPSQRGIGRVMAGLDTGLRSGTAEEVAALVLFLASDAAPFINGAELVIDGGVSVN